MSGKSMKAIAFYSSNNLLGQTILSNYKKSLFILETKKKSYQLENQNHILKIPTT